MLFCFALIGISMILMAAIPSYETIGIAAPLLALVIRMAQGFSLGGELGSNTAYLLEAAPVEQRGLMVSWQQASQLCAVMAASAVGVILSLLMPPDMLEAHGWRVAFLLGAVTLPFGLWMRARLPETLHLAETASAAAPDDAPRLTLAKRATPILILAIVILGCGSITNYLQIYMVTYAQATLGMPASSAFWATMVAALLGIAATLAGGRLSDRFGRRPVNLIGTLALLLTIYPIFYAIIETRSTAVLIVGLAIFVSLSNLTGGVFYANLAELLPKSIRGSAFGTTYAMAIAIFGGSTQLLVTWMIHVTGSAYAPAWLVLGVVAIWLVALLAIPESAPRKLARTGLPLEARL
jgi:MFS family permease